MGALTLGLTRTTGAMAQSSMNSNRDLLMEPDELASIIDDASADCPASESNLMDTLRLVDFRNAEGYTQEHLLTAVNLWYPDVTIEVNGVPGFVASKETIESLMDKIGMDNSIPVVIYGDTGSIYAARLFWILEYYGRTNVRILDGGVTRWKSEKRSLTHDLPLAQSSMFTATPDEGKLVDANWILENLHNPNVVFVDARDADSFAAGHIPGAISKLWKENINWDDESFLPSDQLLARFQEGGIVPEKTIISYCQIGVAGAHNYFALRMLGYPDVRLYDGSWADWSSDPKRPVELGKSGG
jgi:thiosulfate/3-mercaptopyruvate sulfurtransferase